MKTIKCFFISSVVAGTICLISNSSLQAAHILYDGDGRPTSIDGVLYDGDLYDVTVSWNTSFNLVYGVDGSIVTPKFWGDYTAADAGILVLLDALIAEGFSPLTNVSYFTNPVEDFPPPVYSYGRGIYLHRADYLLNTVNYDPARIYATLGLTVWNLRNLYIPADIDTDSDVDGEDLGSFIASLDSDYGSDPDNLAAANLNNDGVVDTQDISLFARSFGQIY